jgi:TonB family protein
MGRRMNTLMKNAATEYLIELPPHSRLPRLDLGIDWESPWTQFRTSLHDFFKGPRPEKDESLPPGSVLRARWIRGKFPAKGFLAACVWHIFAVTLLLLPIWGFLPATAHDLAPVQIELTWYVPPRDLPPISLPAALAKPAAKREAPKVAVEPDPARGADAYHPRQTILSVPVRVTHPRQTLIEPDAPSLPPKIVPQLPNIVEWAASQPKPRPVLPPTESAPRVKERALHDVAAPDVANAEKNPGPINILSTPAVNAQPKLPMIPMSARAAERKSQNDNSAAPAPEINATSGNDTDIRRVIALSATPAPPAPQVNLPEGNLAARISISPDGNKPGTPTNSEHAADGGSPADRGSAAGPSAGTKEGTNGASGANSLPASISISGPISKPGSGGAGPSGASSEKLSLKPVAPPQPTVVTRTNAAPQSSFEPNMPPEKILSGKEVYTMHVNAPNFTSASGSWIMNFAQLDENANPPYKPTGVLSGPVPTHQADPKYPRTLIEQHVKGEVILYGIIRKDGSIDSIQLVRSLDPELDRNAIDALAQWKFRPGTRAGAPVDIEAVIYVPFAYQEP